jgi:hypothetical protein
MTATFDINWNQVVASGFAVIELLLPVFGIVVAVTSGLWLQRRLVRQIEREFGVTILPRSPIETRRLRRTGRNVVSRIGAAMVTGDVHWNQLLLAAEAKYPSSRELYGRLVVENRTGLFNKEIYSNRGEGRSLLLASLATHFSKTDLVFFSHWPAVRERWGETGGKFPPASHEILLLKIFRFRLRGRSIVVIDDCPVPEENSSDAFSFGRFKEAMDRAGVSYILGIPRFRYHIPSPAIRRERRTPCSEPHASWVAPGDSLRLELSPVEVPALVRRWHREAKQPGSVDPDFFQGNKLRIARQLHALHDRFWDHYLRASQLPRPRLTREFLAAVDRCSPDVRLGVYWLSVGQLVSVALPEAAVIALVGPNGYHEMCRLLGGFLRRDSYERVDRVLLHFGGPNLAYALLGDWLTSDERMIREISHLVRATAVMQREDSLSFWRDVLSRVATDYPLDMTVLSRRDVARQIFRQNQELFRDVQDLYWASLLRKVGERWEAGRAYTAVWRARREKSIEADWLYDLSLALGLKDTAPDVLKEPAYLDFALRVARERQGATGKQLVGLADALINALNQLGPNVAENVRMTALQEAESAAVDGLSTRQHQHSCSVLARLLGGLSGPYTNKNGDGRPDVHTAIQFCRDSFDASDAAEALSLQEASAYDTMFRIWLLAGNRLAAIESLRRSWINVPRELTEDETTHNVLKALELVSLLCKPHEPNQETLIEGLAILMRAEKCSRKIAGTSLEWKLSIARAELYRHHCPLVWTEMIQTYNHLIRIAKTDSARATQISAVLDCIRLTLRMAPSEADQIVEAMIDQIGTVRTYLFAMEAQAARAHVANALGWLLFPIRRRVASSCALPVWEVLEKELEDNPRNRLALASLVRIADNIPNYVGKARIDELEDFLQRCCGDVVLRRQIVELLTSENAHKIGRTLPNRFNERLLGVLQTI